MLLFVDGGGGGGNGQDMQFVDAEYSRDDGGRSWKWHRRRVELCVWSALLSVGVRGVVNCCCSFGEEKVQEDQLKGHFLEGR